MKQAITLFLILIAVSCEKEDYIHVNPFQGISTKVLLHRGCGWNEDLLPNTLPAALYGFSILDGVELDIQISKDGTLWMDHNNEVIDCAGNSIGCFNTTTDEVIESHSTCNGVIRYYTLESVFQQMKLLYPEKYISLDIKGQYCHLTFVKKDMERIAEAMLALVTQYGLQGHVIAESNSAWFLEEISESNTLVCGALLVLGDLNQGQADAYTLKARAISYKLYIDEPLTKESVDRVHKKGFGLIVWIVNEPEHINSVWAAQPDFIQTDNPDFMNHVDF